MAWGAAAASIAASAASIGGSYFMGGKKLYRQYKYQKALQKEQQRFLNKLSNTAHQREVADLRKAGLNPILSTGGNGASTPTSGMGTVSDQSADVDFTSAIDAFLNKKRLENESINTENQTRQTNINENKSVAEIENLAAQTGTEQAKQDEISARSNLETLQAEEQAVRNSTMPDRVKKEVEEIGSRVKLNNFTASAKQMDAETNRINAETQQYLAPNQVRYWDKMAKSSMLGSQANMLGSQANMMNSQTNRFLSSAQERNYNAQAQNARTQSLKNYKEYGLLGTTKSKNAGANGNIRILGQQFGWGANYGYTNY